MLVLHKSDWKCKTVYNLTLPSFMLLIKCAEINEPSRQMDNNFYLICISAVSSVQFKHSSKSLALYMHWMITMTRPNSSLPDTHFQHTCTYVLLTYVMLKKQRRKEQLSAYEMVCILSRWCHPTAKRTNHLCITNSLNECATVGLHRTMRSKVAHKRNRCVNYT